MRYRDLIRWQADEAGAGGGQSSQGQPSAGQQVDRNAQQAQEPETVKFAGDAHHGVDRTQPTGQPPDSQPQVQPAENGANAEGQGPGVLTLTQDELDAMIGNRVKAERAKFKDYDSLKSKLQKIEESQKSEAEKQAERLEALERENQELKSHSERLATSQAITASAVAVGMEPDAAVKLIDQNDFVRDEDGRIVNLDELVQALAQKYPGLVQKPGAKPVPKVAPVNAPQAAPGAVPERTDEQRAADYFGIGHTSFWGGSGVKMPQEVE